MKAAIWVRDSFRALPRYLFVLTAVSALALLARAAVPSFPATASHAQADTGLQRVGNISRPQLRPPAADATDATAMLPDAATRRNRSASLAGGIRSGTASAQ